MNASLKQAYQGYLKENQGRGDVMPIFQGPEWFFRRPDRPYTPEEKDATIAALAALSADYPNMLIVAGTMLWATGMDAPGEDAASPSQCNGTRVRRCETAGRPSRPVR